MDDKLKIDNENKNDVAVAPKRSFLLLIGILIICVALFCIVRSSNLAIGTVTVTGNTYLTANEVLKSAHIQDEANVFRLDLNMIKSNLERDVRIERSSIMREFPADIVISVKERIPVACLLANYAYMTVDRYGIILTAHKDTGNWKLPLVSGISVKNMYIGDKIEDERFLKILEYLSYMNETTLRKIRTIDIADTNKITAYSIHNVEIKIGTGERMQEKALLTQEFLAELDNTKLSIEYIDFNYATPFIKFKQ